MQLINEMDAGEFVRRLKHDIEDYEDSKFVFFIGAGCSISSGIPGSKDLVKRWLPRLKKLKTGDENNHVEWAKETFPGYDENSAANLYGTVIEKLFLQSEARQREIEQLIDGIDPGFGYAVLAKLMSNKKYGSHCNAALTVNFDDLIAYALYLYTHKKPLVIAHESLVGFVRSTRKRPLVLKLHGDARLEPKNTNSETSNLGNNVKIVLKNFLSETGLIFMGYGGHDESIANILKELPQNCLPWGIYWVGDEIPAGSIGNWLRERNAILVKQKDFDELMLLIWSEFKLSHPDEERFNNLLMTYRKTFENLKDNLEKKPRNFINTELAKSAQKAIDEAPNSAWGLILKAEGLSRTDNTKSDEIYKQATEKYPRDQSVFESYAIFLWEHCKNYDAADEYFKKSIGIKSNESNLGNYANFLYEVRKDYDSAENYYKKSIKIRPSYANNFGNYAEFLWQIRKNYSKAKKYYEKSVLLDSFDIYHLGNYAGLLLALGDKMGLVLLEKSRNMEDESTQKEWILRNRIYEFLHSSDLEMRQKCLNEIKELLNEGTRLHGWDFSDNIKNAIKENDESHFEAFLDTLIKVISGAIDISDLNNFEEWHQESSQSMNNDTIK